MRGEGESHPSLANTFVQTMIKLTFVDSLVSWSVGEVWAAHGFMRCIHVTTMITAHYNVHTIHDAAVLIGYALPSGNIGAPNTNETTSDHAWIATVVCLYSFVLLSLFFILLSSFLFLPFFLFFLIYFLRRLSSTSPAPTWRMQQQGYPPCTMVT